MTWSTFFFWILAPTTSFSSCSALTTLASKPTCHTVASCIGISKRNFCPTYLLGYSFIFFKSVSSHEDFSGNFPLLHFFFYSILILLSSSLYSFCCCLVAKSYLTLLLPPWPVAPQSPLSMGFSPQEYWSRLPFPSLRDLPNPGTEPTSPALAGKFLTTEPPGKPCMTYLLS